MTHVTCEVEINRRFWRRYVLTAQYGAARLSERSRMVTVMQVRIVKVPMRQSRVTVAVSMRFSRRIVRTVVVLMMLVMNMLVFMLQHLMNVLVFVSFREVQPQSNCY